ncbi:calcium binding protein [Anaeramoeba flamelloides]|uniref:Calcium binding protein n=1 Tax=Anaeramoeba flamelloides TaxID=1746091 RepID=A0ABQ8ZC86_9EUKA|nr:calcium binding protein [Anaeramoeba flamelloides]
MSFQLTKKQIKTLKQKIQKLHPKKKPEKCHLGPSDFEMLFDLDTEGATTLCNAFDLDGNQTVEWKELIGGLAILSSAPIEDKAEFLFNTWDLDGNGILDRDEVEQMLTSIVTIAGTVALCDQFEQVKSQMGTDFDKTNFEHRKKIRKTMKVKGDLSTVVDEFFEKVNTDNTGEISLEQFQKYCKKDPMSITTFEDKIAVLTQGQGNEGCVIF